MEKAKWITPGRVILVALVAIGIYLYGYANEVRSVLIDFQTGANAEYKSNQNYLASYQSGFYETVGIANLKSAKMDKIILDAVKGRYEGNTSAKPGGGSLFSAIAEAYPDLAQLNIFDKAADYVKAGRAGYRDKQDGLVDRLRAFDKWRQDGIVRHYLIELAGFPSNGLVACAGPNDCKYGAEALQRMWNIVLTEETEVAYKTSKMAPLVVPQN